MITPSSQVDQNQTPEEIQSAASRIILTLEVTQSIGGAIASIPPVPVSTSQQASASTKMLLPILVSSLGGTALLVFAFLWYIHRRDRSGRKAANKTTRNESSVTEQNHDSVITVSSVAENPETNGNGQMAMLTPISSDHKSMTNPDGSEPVAVTVWLRNLDPDILRSRHLNQAGSGTQDSFENIVHADETPVTPVNQTLLRREVFGEELGRNTQISYEVQRTLKASRYEQMRGTAPTSTTNLEIQFQRLYGFYNTWSHEHVMEWAGLKRLDPAVVEIFKNYHIDGPLLATLDVHSLKEKCGVEDFRLRAKFIQAVEFLKDSSRSLRNLSTGSDVDGDSLPQYERSPDQ
ncbi:hypothetical protein HDU76_013960 [Blyttiomyces sp. JEL0837]|nr:hypothetical protein HDU76_013960 [Blyttiomyces sp. JEL0837]